VERLGRYELLEELGRGAMGVVYKGRDPQIDRLVAIKLMLAAEGLDPSNLQQWRERFLREARAAGRLAHPHIVTIHDVGEEQGRSFLVMEFIQGQTLESVLRAQRNLPLEEAVTIGEQVAGALDYAHRHGVVHRDIKPANILLTQEGIVKVTDFGIARIAGAAFTKTGHVLGTPSYMSPEQISGLKVDGRSDIFSLGAVLYELLSGEKAFHGETISTVMYRIIHEDPTPLRRLNAAFPHAVDACLKKALAKDPARRYARADDLARDLRGVIEPKAMSRPPAPTVTATRVAAPRAPSPLPAPRRASPWWWLGLGGVAAAGLALALGLWLRPSRAPAPPIQTTPRVEVAEVEARRKADAERLAVERQRLEVEKARLAQQQAALEAERKRAAEELARQKAADLAAAQRKAGADQGSAKRDVPAPGPAAITGFQFVGNSLISGQELEGVLRDRLGQPMSPEELRIISERVSRYYSSRGYLLAKAHPRPQGMRDGILPIEVTEGRIGRVRVGGFVGREARIIEATLGSALRNGVVERGSLRAAIRSLAEQHRLIVNLSVEPGGAPGTLDLFVKPSRSGQVEIQLPGEPGPKLFPLKAKREK
jgi:predicted Ser/Thr protein kinase